MVPLYFQLPVNLDASSMKLGYSSFENGPAEEAKTWGGGGGRRVLYKIYYLYREKGYIKPFQVGMECFNHTSACMWMSKDNIKCKPSTLSETGSFVYFCIYLAGWPMSF